jgi:hypothetical protein
MPEPRRPYILQESASSCIQLRRQLSKDRARSSVAGRPGSGSPLAVTADQDFQLRQLVSHNASCAARGIWHTPAISRLSGFPQPMRLCRARRTERKADLAGCQGDTGPGLPEGSAGGPCEEIWLEASTHHQHLKSA